MITIEECMARIATEQRIKEADIHAANKRCEAMTDRHMLYYLKQFEGRFTKGDVIELYGEVKVFDQIEYDPETKEYYLHYWNENGEHWHQTNPELADIKVIRKAS